VSWRRPAWFDERDASLAKRILLAPLVPIAWLYALAATLARRARGPRFRTPVRLACRVVSVGNLTLGGSGKTPAAAWIAARLREAGHPVALASRGYGRRGREPVVVVSDGRFVRATLDAAGDEALLLAAHAPGVPVLVGRDRAWVGLRAIAAFGADVLVLDDGLQHHRLARDVEIVCFDGGGLGNGRVFPRGPLREPRAALRDADAVLVVDGPLAETDEAAIRRAAPRAAWFAARRRPVSLRPLGGGAVLPPSALAGQSVGLLAGIARPASLRRTLETLGATVVAERVFPDHHRYRARDVADLVDDAKHWITTEKDAAKILPRQVGAADVRVLAIELAPDDPQALLDWLERTLRAKRR
jgi:tetraacyldisaccharide 4'-kinase